MNILPASTGRLKNVDFDIIRVDDYAWVFLDRFWENFNLSERSVAAMRRIEW